MLTSTLPHDFHRSEASPAGFVSSQASRLDKLGASLSFACAIHCAAQPLLLALLPLMGLGVLLDERLESIFLVCSVILASSTVIGGWRHHRQPQALPLLGLAVVLIVCSRLPLLEAFEIPLAVSGALGIMSSHLYNLYLHRKSHPDHSHAPHSHHEHLHPLETLEHAVEHAVSELVSPVELAL